MQLLLLTIDLGFLHMPNQLRHLKQQNHFGPNMFGFENVAALRNHKHLTDYVGGWMLFKGSRVIAVERFLEA